MSDQQYEVGLNITTQSDDAKLRDVSAQLEKLNAQTQQLTQSHQQAKVAADEHAGAIGGLAQKFAGLAGGLITVQKLFSMFKEGTIEALEQQRALSQLGNTAKQYGQDATEAAEATKAMARQLEAVGFNESEIIKATQQLMVVTKDYAQAISASSLAADIAIKSGLDYGTALTLVRNLITDSPRGLLMAQRLLGVEAHSSAEALAALSAGFRGAAAAADDAKAKISAGTSIIKESFKEFGGVIGTALGGVVNALGSMVKKYDEASIEVQYIFRKMIGSTADADKWYAEAVQKWKELFGIPIAKEMAKLNVIDDWEKRLKVLGEKMKADMATLTKDVDRDVADQEKADRQAAEEERGRDRTREGNLQRAQKLQQLRDLYALVEPATLAKEKEINDKIIATMRLRDAMVESAEKQHLGNLSKLDDRRLQEYRQELLRELQAYKLSLEARNALTLELARIEYEIRVRAGQQQLELAGQNLADQFGLGQVYAATMAWIHAFAAAAGAAADTPGDVYTRIAAYIAAFAETIAAYKAITAASPGSAAPGISGSAPAAPTVYTGKPPAGSTSATPAITNVNTTNAPATTVINVQALDTTNALRSAQRALRPAGRSYDRTIVSRKSVVVGSNRGR
jgi:hypothetical protein